jgi:membrane-bound lytic murein transglycosylase D
MKDKVREEIRATVSQLPLEVNDAVLGYVHYFSSERGRRTLIAGLKRAGRYRPLISRILDEEGVPQELLHLAQAESAFLPLAVSRKAATGMWQFVRDRGRQYGLLQTATTDDRLDPEQATRAAARHLRDLFDRYGDWYLAMAAYNCGPGCVDRAVQRTGYADFWQLRDRRVLPRETCNYVPVILAVTIMSKNPNHYGVDVEPDRPVEYDTIRLSAPTQLALISDVTDLPLGELRELNPSVLKNVAPAGHLVRVPKGSGAAVTGALELVPSASRASSRLHRVVEGDTLAGIAKRYGTQAGSIAAVNHLTRESFEAGDRLVVPVAQTAPGRRTVARKNVGKSSQSQTRPLAARTGSGGTQTAGVTNRPASYQTASLNSRPQASTAR